jgi:enterochelin esterase-like enzyme
VPWVDTHYATAADWSHRVIGGMSSGGFCALDQGLRHPELYGAIIALEAYDNPGSGGGAMLATSAEITAHSPGKYLPTMTFVHPVTVFLSAGAWARGGDASEASGLAAQLAARGQTVLYRIEPGQFHTWTMARTSIPYGLIAVSAALAP